MGRRPRPNAEWRSRGLVGMRRDQHFAGAAAENGVVSEHLFVYGTLAPGQPNEQMLSGIAGTWEQAAVRRAARAAWLGRRAGLPSARASSRRALGSRLGVHLRRTCRSLARDSMTSRAMAISGWQRGSGYPMVAR